MLPFGAIGRFNLNGFEQHGLEFFAAKLQQIHGLARVCCLRGPPGSMLFCELGEANHISRVKVVNQLQPATEIGRLLNS